VLKPTQSVRDLNACAHYAQGVHWEDFDFGGRAWRRRIVGGYEAQVSGDDSPATGTRKYRVIQVAGNNLVMYGVTTLSQERTERMLEAAISVLGARKTTDIPAVG
jgi:hypothetical protein